jgi:mRNA-degrading endonuclease YafQ of YafQ-DinJ toxin-antitoxin module
MAKKINDLRIDFSTKFEKQLKECPRVEKTAFLDAYDLFIENPHHENLRNHPLKKRLAGYRSIDVTGIYRAVFKEKKTGKQKNIIFHLIGRKSDLYRDANAPK